MLNVFNLVLMMGMFLYMFNKAKLARTRRMALIPLGCAVMELLTAGMLTPALFPLLTVLLIALRVTILLCCVGAIRKDAQIAMHRAKRSSAQSMASTTTACTKLSRVACISGEATIASSCCA